MARLRIVTSNLLVDRARPEAVASAISQHRPDVVAVQELGAMNAAVIRSGLGYGKLDPRADGFGLGIAARRPIRVERLDLEERPGWVAHLDASDWGIDRSFVVVNVHLTNPVDLPWSRSRRSRRAQITAVADFVTSLDGPYIIVGDMNSSPSWPEYRRLSELGRDAARATGTARPTWSHFVRGPRIIRIDHGFVSGAEPIMTRTIPIRGTDHRALLIDVEV
jgi:endonuclease/exonuclease/phosphatase (EEP) superfamily protein YafD